MATATVKKTAITVKLSLTELEARTLHALVGNVTGSDSRSPRKHTDAIWSALGKVGITSAEERRLLTGPGSFKDYWRTDERL